MKEKFLKGLKWFYQSFIWLFVLLLVTDIVTKQIIMHSGVDPESGHTLVADWGFVRIRYILNYKAAFGIGASDPNVSRILYLVIASLAIAGLMVFLILKRKTTKLYIRACLVMIITGALGNMIDRIFYAPYRAVVDWIDFWWVPGWVWVFNIADSCIVVAAFMLIIYLVIVEVKELIAKRNAEVGKEVVLSKSEKERLESEKSDKNESK